MVCQWSSTSDLMLGWAPPDQCGKQKLPCSGHCCTGTVLEPPGCRNRPTACWPAPEQAGCLLAPVARNRPCSCGRLPCCTGTGRPPGPGPSSQSWPAKTNLGQMLHPQWACKHATPAASASPRAHESKGMQIQGCTNHELKGVQIQGCVNSIP